MSSLYVQSKVCIAPFHVRSKVCITPMHVRRKVCKFALHMDGINADFAPYMEGSHADWAPHMELRHSFREQIIPKTASFSNFQRELFKTTDVTTFENKVFWRRVHFNYFFLFFFGPYVVILVESSYTCHNMHAGKTCKANSTYTFPPRQQTKLNWAFQAGTPSD